MQHCVQGSVPAELQQKAVHSLLLLLQASKEAGHHAEAWHVRCLALIAPGSAKSIQQWFCTSDGKQLPDLQLLVRSYPIIQAGLLL